MPIEHRIRQLVEEALDSDRTPDEVCRDCPELLGEVRSQWERVRAVEAHMDALFPRPDGPPPDEAAFRDEETGLPRIEGYDVEAVVGRGGMGVVYRARHRKLNRPVALKMILAGAYASPQDRARFQREAEAVAALRHPNVVQVYDSGEAGGRPYFTMEFIEGGTLAEKLAGTPLSARPAAEFLAALAGAVQAAHASGIVHRDLKPANVLLTADGTPKVTDFGLARHVAGGPELTLSGTRVGTPSYMAPEQALGRSRAIGPATDVYALGAILYELLTGRPPFKGESAAETERQVIAMDPVPPSRLNARVPRDLETICLKCLHKEPHRRYVSAAALADDLGRFLRGDVIAARPEGRLGRLVRQFRRRPVFSTALAAGLLTAAALAGGGLWLASERAADARAAEAARAATERAANEDLLEMVRSLKESAWPEARAALERARGRLGDGGSVELRRLLDQGDRDLSLAIRLEELRPELVGLPFGDLSLALHSDQEYSKAFRGAGFGQVYEDPEVVADRVRASNIRDALVAALDHWSSITTDEARRSWLLTVARRADHDPTGWRDRARDEAVRKDKAALARLIATAPVADRHVSLLLALVRSLKPDSPELVLYLKRIQEAHPDDFWVNHILGVQMARVGKPEEGIGYLRAALAARPGAAIVHNDLGVALVQAGCDGDEALGHLRQAVELAPTVGGFHYTRGAALCRLGRHDEAIEELRVALRFEPNVAEIHRPLARSLEAKGRPTEALAEYGRAVALDPKNTDYQKDLRSFFIRQGRPEEARAAWAKALAAAPSEHAAWYGYAEFCLFLGQEDEYRRARQALLAQFGTATDPYVAERTARASLLRPASGDELRQAVVLAGRAADADRSKYRAAYPYFLFARGLADYRQGRFEGAIAAMRGEAGRVLGPAPGLVLAMALHQSGQAEEARKTLAAAIRAYDWSAGEVHDQDGWIYHVLRREAERLVQSDLPDLPEGP